MEIEKKFKVIDASTVNDIIRHPHKEAEEYENFLYYSDGEYPKELIDRIRPNEHEVVKKYRKETYQPVFCEIFDRVMNALNKIQRADGFYLKYPQLSESDFSSIAVDERLENYLTYHFTQSKSLMNWAFQVCLKQYVIDANGVIVIWAEQTEDATEYKNPKPFVINSDKIIYHYEGNSIVYKGEGTDYYSIDSESWCRWERSKRGLTYVLAEQVFHGLGMFPGFTIGGIVEEEEELGREYQSRFKGMLPWLNVATIEFSDLRAEITQHIHSTVWIYQDEQCPSCSGLGYLIRENEKVPCTNGRCKGGQIPVSPYETIRIRPAKTTMGEVPAPTPPMGYVQKQTEIAELQDKRINEMRYKSLAAINMQFLDASPVAQSGVAKAYDRDETNNTFYGVAVDMGGIMEKVAFLVAKWRYGTLYTDAELKAMCPICVIPNTFDILGSNLIVQEIKTAKDSTLNDAVLSEMELEFIKKRFPNDVTMQNKMKDAFHLDPASGKSEEQVALLVSNKLMSKQDAVISTYITDFIDRAYEEVENFHELPKRQKQVKLYQYADEKLKDINTKDQLYRKIFQTAPVDASGDVPTPADLKYTVGGLSGIIEVVKAVSSGVYDLEAAVRLVMDRFGLTEDEARAQIGTPKVVSSESDLNKIKQLT